MQMPERMILYENGIHRSPRLRDQRDMEELRKRNASQSKTNGISAATKVAFVLFSMFSLAITVGTGGSKIGRASCTDC